MTISDTGTTGNKVQGNFIGTDVTGTLDLGNVVNGVIIERRRDNTVGGTVAGARNVISGNTNDGVHINGAGASGNNVLGNFIGTSAVGTAAVGNGNIGVFISSSAVANTVGGTSLRHVT